MSAQTHAVRLSEHPRAMRQIEAARGGAAVAALGLILLLSLRAGLPVFDAGLRALAAGVAAYLVIWAAGVQVWRHLAVAELEAARREALERRRKAREAAPDPDGFR